MTRSPHPPQLDRASDGEAELIRAALARQADRAPRADAVLSVLAAAPRRTPWRPAPSRPVAGLAAGLTAAAAVAGVSVAARGAGGESVPVPGGAAASTSVPATTGPSSTVSSPPNASSDPLAVALRYSPTWLPPGLQEQQRWRSVEPTGTHLDRTWVRRTPPSEEPGRSRLDLLVAARPSLSATEGAPVDVGGVPGRLVSTGQDDKTLLQWQPRPGTWLVLVQAGLGLDAPTMVRIAASVTVDPGAYGIPLGLAPTQRRQVTAFGTTVDGPRDWRAVVVLRGVTISRATAPDPDAPAGGRVVQVAGRQGRYSVVSHDQRTAWLVVPLADGTVLTVSSGPTAPTPKTGADGPTSAPDPQPTSPGGPVLSAAELVAVAEAVDLGTMPDVSWAR